jgi:hypothetical protein
LRYGEVERVPEVEVQARSIFCGSLNKSEIHEVRVSLVSSEDDVFLSDLFKNERGVLGHLFKYLFSMLRIIAMLPWM